MARVYLETSFVSACVTTRMDVASAYRHQASLEWWADQARRHRLFVSDEVLAELGSPANPNAVAALALIRDVPRLELGERAQGLAAALVAHKVMPSPAASGDALHVAVAIVHDMDFMLSWNVRHLANPNKLDHLRTICLRLGVVPPRIVTPDLLWEFPHDAARPDDR